MCRTEILHDQRVRRSTVFDRVGMHQMRAFRGLPSKTFKRSHCNAFSPLQIEPKMIRNEFIGAEVVINENGEAIRMETRRRPVWIENRFDESDHDDFDDNNESIDHTGDDHGGDHSYVATGKSIEGYCHSMVIIQGVYKKVLISRVNF